LLGMVPGLAGAGAGGYALSGNNLTAFYILGIELGPWEDYLMRELTPGLQVMGDLPQPRISWMDGEESIILPVFARDLVLNPSNTRLSFGFDSQIDTRLAAGSSNVFSQAGQDYPGSQLKREILTPGLFHQIDQNSVLGVSAVLAYQRFSAPGLGYMARQDSDPLLRQSSSLYAYEETTFGTGVRLALRNELIPGMAFDAGYQSRIDMEEFNNYRGVYSEPGDLDIPAKAHLGLELKATENAYFTVGVDHVLYSDVNAFPSRFLPERFVSLLGDSSSPEFAWDDLTVYSVGWRWRQREDVEWWIDVTTRQQPTPTAGALSRALNGELADSAMLMGFSKRTSQNGRLNVTAAYAPPEYAFGGSVLGVTSENLDQTLELEALWIWKF